MPTAVGPSLAVGVGVTGAAGGGGNKGVYLDPAGAINVCGSSAARVFSAGQTIDTAYRFQIDSNGLHTWQNPAAPALATTLAFDSSNAGLVLTANGAQRFAFSNYTTLGAVMSIGNIALSNAFHLILGDTTWNAVGTAQIQGLYYGTTIRAPSGWSLSNVQLGMNYAPVFSDANLTGNVTGIIYGLYLNPQLSFATRTLGTFYGVQISPSYGANSAPAITNYRMLSVYGGTITQPITDWRGIEVGLAAIGTGGSVTTAYGLYVIGTSAAATTYGVYVTGGVSFFGGGVTVGALTANTATVHMNMTSTSAWCFACTLNGGGAFFGCYGGILYWGPSTGGTDTNLYRGASNQLNTSAGWQTGTGTSKEVTTSIDFIGGGQPILCLGNAHDTLWYRNGVNTIVIWNGTNGYGTLQAATFQVNSDRANKSAIQKLTAATHRQLAETMLAAPVYTYRRKGWGKESHLGLMADELPEQIVEEGISPQGEEHGTEQFVSLYKLCAALTATVQHLNERLLALEGA